MNEKLTWKDSAAVITLLALNTVMWTVAIGEVLLFWLILP